MANPRTFNFLVAGAVGVVGGYYIFAQPLQELSGHGAPAEPPKDGRSQSVKDGNVGSGSANPRASLKEGGATPINPMHQTVAGQTAESRRSGSADHSPNFRENANVHDGTSGGGVGVAEMRERKMKGQGLPSPQGGDTKAQPVPGTATAQEDEVQTAKRTEKSGGWGWFGNKSDK